MQEGVHGNVMDMAKKLVKSAANYRIEKWLYTCAVIPSKIESVSNAALERGPEKKKAKGNKKQLTHRG